MSRVLLSILGTGNYLKCNYVFNSKDNIQNMKFVQEASVRYYCKGWNKEDNIKIFVTNEAYDKNWKEDAENGQSLYNIFKEMSHEQGYEWINPDQIFVRIPTVRNSDDIIVMFNIIFEALPENSEVILDITHSFRYLPMLLMSIAGYAKYLKKVSIAKVIYGAIEVLGNLNNLQKIDIKNRNAPVLDLTGLTDILSWTEAVRDFNKFGNADMLSELIKKDVGTEFKEKRGDEYIKAYGEIGRFLKEISEVTSTSRGERLYKLHHIKEAFEIIQESENLKIKTILPLMNEVEGKISGLEKNSFKNGIIAARWCHDHNMIQQGYTILQETVVSMICGRFNLNYKEKESREAVSKALNVKAFGIPFNEWDQTLKSLEKSSEIVLFVDKELAEWYTNFAGLRNNLNHAGIGKNNIKFNKFKSVLKDGIEYISQFGDKISK